MITLVSALLGAALGAWQALRRKGSWPDVAQYAAAYALIFTVLGTFLGIYLARAG